MSNQERTYEDFDHIVTRQQIAAVLDRVIQLEERVSSLERERGVPAPPGTPEACRNHTCDYYRQYLSYGPKELEHEGYHAAIERMSQIGAWVDRYVENHGYDEGASHRLSLLADLEKLVRV